jgi:organic hydroperoxide reductase OsmC/OhrA
MQAFPHVYSVAAAGAQKGSVSLTAAGLPRLVSAAPAEFDGPGDQWSPESLLCAAVASCFVLSFRSVARAAGLQWTRLECEVEGTLERILGVTRFTKVIVRAVLTVPESTAAAASERVLHKAEQSCLIANSLVCDRELRTEVLRAPVLESVAL